MDITPYRNDLGFFHNPPSGIITSNAGALGHLASFSSFPPLSTVAIAVAVPLKVSEVD
jgi:hypothetical protein